MPRKKREENQEQVENDDPSDNEPFDWSDEENGSSSDQPKDGDANLRILSELAQHGFDVKGKLTDGKVSFIFRSPRQGTPRVDSRGSDANPEVKTPREKHHREIVYGERERVAPPPYKEPSAYRVDPGSKHGRRGYQVRKHVRSLF
jgi:hypothetical protein